jgi:hypothetical protein
VRYFRGGRLREGRWRRIVRVDEVATRAPEGAVEAVAGMETELAEEVADEAHRRAPESVGMVRAEIDSKRSARRAASPTPTGGAGSSGDELRRASGP